MTLRERFPCFFFKGSKIKTETTPKQLGEFYQETAKIDTQLSEINKYDLFFLRNSKNCTNFFLGKRLSGQITIIPNLN